MMSIYVGKKILIFHYAFRHALIKALEGMERVVFKSQTIVKL